MREGGRTLQDVSSSQSSDVFALIHASGYSGYVQGMLPKRLITITSDLSRDDGRRAVQLLVGHLCSVRWLPDDVPPFVE